MFDFLWFRDLLIRMQVAYRLGENESSASNKAADCVVFDF